MEVVVDTFESVSISTSRHTENKIEWSEHVSEKKNAMVVRLSSHSAIVWHGTILRIQSVLNCAAHCVAE